MLNRQFKYEHDDERGLTGWIPVDMAGANAMDNFGVAHDVMEHLPNDDVETSTHAELMALGACILVRVENNWWVNNNLNRDDPSDILGYDIEEICNYICAGSQILGDPGKSYKIRDEVVEELIDDIARTGINLFLKNVAKHEPNNYEKFKNLLNPDFVIGWLRKGYRKAVKRYSNLCTFELGEIYTKISREVEKTSIHAEVGNILSVNISIKQGHVKVIHKYPWGEKV